MEERYGEGINPRKTTVSLSPERILQSHNLFPRACMAAEVFAINGASRLHPRRRFL